MAYSETLAGRIRQHLRRRRDVAEKKMFGGVGFLLGGHLVVGVWKESLVARVGPDDYAAALREADVGEFAVTGRAMTGWVLVGPAGVAEDDALAEWIDRCLAFVATLPAK